MVPESPLIMAPKAFLITVPNGVLIKDLKSTKCSLNKKPLHAYKPFLIIVITKSFLRIRTFKRKRNVSTQILIFVNLIMHNGQINFKSIATFVAKCLKCA